MHARYVAYPNAVTRPLLLPDGRTAEVSYDLFGEHVEQEDGSITPARFSYREQLSTGARWLVEFGHDEHHRPRIDSIHIERNPNSSGLLTADFATLRSSRNFTSLTEDVWLAVSRRPAVHAGELDNLPPPRDLAEAKAEMKHTIRGLGRQSRSRIAPEKLAAVARVHFESRSSGKPIRAVMERFGVAESTANRHVKLARERGHFEALEARGGDR
jgi:hypothetical protein